MVFVALFIILNILFLLVAWIVLLVTFLQAWREGRKLGCWITGVPLALLSIAGIGTAAAIAWNAAGR